MTMTPFIMWINTTLTTTTTTTTTKTIKQTDKQKKHKKQNKQTNKKQQTSKEKIKTVKIKIKHTNVHTVGEYRPKCVIFFPNNIEPIDSKLYPMF